MDHDTGKSSLTTCAPVAVQWLLRPTLPASDLKSGNQYTLLNMPQRLQKFRCDRDARIFWYWIVSPPLVLKLKTSHLCKWIAESKINMPNLSLRIMHDHMVIFINDRTLKCKIVLSKYRFLIETRRILPIYSAYKYYRQFYLKINFCSRWILAFLPYRNYFA